MKLIEIKQSYISAEMISCLGKTDLGREFRDRYVIWIRLMGDDPEGNSDWEACFEDMSERDTAFMDLLEFLMKDREGILKLN